MSHKKAQKAQIIAATALLIIVTAIFAVAVAAQTSVSVWPYYVEVTPQKSSPGMYDVIVPLPVMDKARGDLADLRLFDSANREIPYAIRVRRDVAERRDMTARIFNAATTGPAAEVSIDLGDNPGEHNEIDVATNGTNFRRQVIIEGSDSGTEWRTLNSSGMIFSFASLNGSVASQRVTYPTSRYRYLRVRVLRDPVTDDRAPQITNVNVTMAVREKGMLSSWSVAVPSYQLLRNQGEFATTWVIDLGGRAPCDRLKLEIADDSFSRPFQVFAIDDPDNVHLVASGTLTRYTGDEPKPLTINFNQEEYVRKLRLQVTDYSNPTLGIMSIEASAPARQLVFELKERPSQPLRLFFGNPTVAAPHYDFEKELAVRLSTEPADSSLGAVISNPEYRPEPKPFTERAPWLIYLVLAASSIALGYVLFSLARTTTRMKSA